MDDRKELLAKIAQLQLEVEGLKSEKHEVQLFFTRAKARELFLRAELTRISIDLQSRIQAALFFEEQPATEDPPE